MRQIRNERGLVLVVALGLTVALAALALTVSRSGQMSTLTGALSAQATRAFHLADGAAHHALGDVNLFQPDNVVRTKNLEAELGMKDSQAAVVFTEYRALPGNLLIRTTDGRVRAAQFGQNEGLGKMYYFNVD